MIDTTGTLFTGGMGAATWLAAGWDARRQRRARSGLRATGLVTQVSATARGGSSSVVRFVDETGTPQRVNVDGGRIGEEVQLGYSAGMPQQARRIGGIGSWGFSIMATLVGAVFFSVAEGLLTNTTPLVFRLH